MSLTASVDTGELRWAEEGEVAGLGKQRTDGQRSVACWSRRRLGAKWFRRRRLLPPLLSSLPPQELRTSAAAAETASSCAVRLGRIMNPPI